MIKDLKYYSIGAPLPNYGIDGPKRVVHIEDADVLVVYGGDGSILRGAQQLIRKGLHDVVILGVNTGHVGFLSNDIDTGKALVFLKDPKDNLIEKRSILHVSTNDKELYALNEIVVQPTKRGPLFETTLSIDGEKLVYKGDGIIIATPSGSTAYNLSAGGPILHPSTTVLSITPICPFSLAARPIVIPDTSLLSISTTAEAEVSIDGVSVLVDRLQNILVNRASFTINLVKFASFFEAIHEKLGWNRSIK